MDGSCQTELSGSQIEVSWNLCEYQFYDLLVFDNMVYCRSSCDLPSFTVCLDWFSFGNPCISVGLQ